MTAVEYQIILQDRFSSTMSKINNKLDRFNNELSETNRKTKKLKTGFGGLGGSLGTMVKGFGLVGLAIGIGKIGKSIIGLGADMEQTKVSFSVMLGSMDKATKMVDDINAFANVTPFENDALFQTTKLLLNYGIAQKDMMPTMKMLGDVSGGSAEKLNRLALAYGQARSLGRLQGQDMKQMIEVGFNPLQEMARTTGKSMEELSEMMRKGQIPIKMVDEAFASATAEGGKFHNMMEKQSKTLAGRWSTFMGKLKMVGIQIGTKLLPGLGKGVDFMTKFMESATKNFHYIKEALQPLIMLYKELFVAIGKLFKALFKTNGEGGKSKEIWKKIGTAIKYLTGPLKFTIKLLTWLIEKGAKLITWLRDMYDKFAGLRKVIDFLLIPLKAVIKAFKWVADKVNDDDGYDDGKRLKSLNKMIKLHQHLLKLQNQGTKLRKKDLMFMRAFNIMNKNNRLYKLSRKLAGGEGGAGAGLEGGAGAGLEESDKIIDPLKDPLGAVEKQAKKDSYKITGAAPKIFNLNVSSIGDNMTIQTNTIQESGEQVYEFVLETLQKALVDVQTSVR